MGRLIRFIFRLAGALLLLSAVVLTLAFCFRTYQTVKRVEKYRPQVAEICQKYGIPQETETILGIIMTESKGKTDDLMQSSESIYGEQAAIDSTNESLEVGISHFAEMLAQANKLGLSESVAVQAYNFGADYIPYVAANGGKQTKEVAKKYSKEVLAPKLGNATQATYPYYHLFSLLDERSLYLNGGNYFYASIVQMNKKLIRFYESLPWVA